MPDSAAEPPAVEDDLGPPARRRSRQEAVEDPDPFDATGEDSRYRQVLGHFATGVTVVTGSVDGQPLGLSVNSFTSASLLPPLVAFCVAETSSTWPRIRSSGRFCVNILAEDQEHVSRLFATRRGDKFTGIGWRPAPSGSPILAGGLAWIDCAVQAEHDAGDHLIVVGRAQEMEVDHEDGPLVFYRGGYGRFER